MDVSAYIPETRFKVITLFIVIFSLGVALMIPSVELIIGLVGSTIGVAICIMFPAACYRAIIRKDNMERSFAQLIIVGGFCLMILGTYANLSAIDEKSSGAHLEVPKVNENLFKPTELPKDMDLDEKIKNIEKAIEQKYAKVEENKKDVPDPVLKVNTSQLTPVVQKPALPPPLPVDEVHPPEDSKQKPKQVQEFKVSVEKMQEPPPPRNEIKPMENGDTLKSSSDIKNEQKLSEPEKNLENKKTTANSDIQQQTIDNDAIKKDEEIAKEEMKIQKKDENDELKKTKEELEKTKDLLEKKVEELKEELVKQNQETQNLVVEKLGEVVEKFEEIERKVQKQQDDMAPPNPASPNQASKDQPKEDSNKAANETANNVKPSKGSLISILTDNRNLSNNNQTNEELRVYEPLSYKTGELIESVRNASHLEKRLPLPLALLINASQAKINESNADASKLNHTIELHNITTSNNKSKDDEDKINIDSIRRDILQLRDRSDEAPTKDDETNEGNHRIKRSNYDNKENCLPEPKIETLMASSLSETGGLTMKIGRDLKSINGQD